VNLSETADLLSAMSAFDRRTIGDGDVIAWQAILPDAAFEDCLEAVKQHYAEQTDWMMPAHVRRAVRDMVSQRDMAARHTGWAPGQAGVPKDRPMPTELRPSAAETGQEIKRLALSDLPAAVADLVARVRADLPEGSREALKPRTVAWEREHAAFRRQQDAEPNPHYRPKTETCTEPEVCYRIDHAHNYPLRPGARLTPCGCGPEHGPQCPTHGPQATERCCADQTCRCEPGECYCITDD
jgi:hypothetical protein